MIDHRFLNSRLLIEGELIPRSPLRIGGAREESPFQMADLSLIRIFYKDKLVPYIPGSSIKGVLRSIVEKIYQYENKQSSICEITNPRNSCGGRFRETLNAFMKKRDNDALNKFIEENFCDICKIFGTSGYKSNIFINDAYPVSENSFKIETRAGIGIDRIKGFTSQGALYSTEFIVPNSRFSLSFSIENIPNSLLKWIFMAIRLINDQRAFLGSFSTKGFGRVEVLLQKVEYNTFKKTVPPLKLPSLVENNFQNYTKSIIEFLIQEHY